MTLNRQLWFAILLVLIMAFVGTFAVSTLSAKRYLEQQLRVKNLDNATSLALSMSQMPKDLVTIELLLAAQFDAGHYRLIRLTSPSGEILVERTSVVNEEQWRAPDWLVALFPIEVPDGIAQVQDGWHQFGTLTLSSHHRFAYEALWRGTKQLLLWFVVLAALAGLVGTALLRVILRPMDDVIHQAEAIGGRHFITLREPWTTEFRRLVRAMNTLSYRVREMLGKEAGKVDELLRQAQTDTVTGLLNRDAFMAQFESRLHDHQRQATGTLALLRLDMLDDLNRKLGHRGTDDALARIGERLRQCCEDRATPWSAGRLSGNTLALLAPGAAEAEQLGKLLRSEVSGVLAPHGIDAAELPVGASGFQPGEPRSEILARTDAAVNNSAETGQLVIKHAGNDDDGDLPSDLIGWRQLLEPALTADAVSLGDFAVIQANGAILHHEAPVRLTLEGRRLAAGHFIGWVARLDWMPRLDRLVLSQALKSIRRDGGERAINLSIETVCDRNTVDWICEEISRHPLESRKLWLDIAEHGALRHLPEFRSFCDALRPLGCRIGLKHAGRNFSRIAELHDLGLHHLKLDASFSRSGNADAFLRGVCTLVHSIGMVAIGEGIASREEQDSMFALGVDAVTGPGIKVV